MLTKESILKELFRDLPDSSKVWIYQANREMTEKEVVLINQKGNDFVLSWESHGSKLKANFTVLYNLFLVFAVDENQHEASGCSIDKSVHFVKEAQGLTGINFFDRTIVAYFSPENSINLVPLSGISLKVKNNEININTLIFNNLIDNLSKIRSEWIISAGNSWLSRFL